MIFRAAFALSDCQYKVNEPDTLPDPGIVLTVHISKQKKRNKICHLFTSKIYYSLKSETVGLLTKIERFKIMKKIFILVAMAVAAVVMTGCTTTTTSDGASLMPTPQSTHPGYEAQYDLKAQRVSGKATIHVLFGLIAWGADGFADNSELSTFSFLPSSSNFAKSAAVYNTCQANKVDTLVGTRYRVTTTDYVVYKNVKCEVAGFPATMVGAKLKKAYVVPGGNPAILWSAEKPTVLK